MGPSELPFESVKVEVLGDKLRNPGRQLDTWIELFQCDRTVFLEHDSSALIWLGIICPVLDLSVELTCTILNTRTQVSCLPWSLYNEQF